MHSPQVSTSACLFSSGNLRTEKRGITLKDLHLSGAGSWQFYLATFFTAAIWLGTWLKWGDRRCFSGAAPRELARGAGIGIALIIPFLLGALIVRSIPALAGPVSDLPDNMCHGSVPMTLATLVINGVGEELFFHDVARRALSDISSPTPSLISQVALYIAVTAAMGVSNIFHE
ncbi:hypothetical protein [Corynebacterium sp. HMSC078H07]|uniref:hypothetical protein n=1 Tax=Corynebacterium sp. HMSC078H07 TaxID=1739379 RepID=UPI0008A190F4|nr:hypothetical protein [Corynebacterium sp. HMSC078H07]OFR62944.1 hypothetical protein HMPREF2875_03160 [Corynebacterium sp. HMSC078H07]